MLVINSILWYTFDQEVGENISDPDKQFDWLTTQLDQARTGDQRVTIEYLIMIIVILL